MSDDRPTANMAMLETTLSCIDMGLPTPGVESFTTALRSVYGSAGCVPSFGVVWQWLLQDAKDDDRLPVARAILNRAFGPDTFKVPGTPMPKTPTREGYYWYTDGKWGNKTIAHVDASTDELSVSFCGNSKFFDLTAPTITSGEWGDEVKDPDSFS